MTFIHVLPSHQVKSLTRLLPKAEIPVPTPDASCEPEIYKVLVCDMGKVERTKSPTPGPTQQEEPCTGRAGHQPGSQRQGRKGLPAPTWGWGNKLMQSWAGRNQKRNWQHGVLEGWSGMGIICTPLKRKEGKLERPWETQRMGQPLRRLFLRTCRPARVAISNTSRTPSLVLAEHSR